MRASDVEQLAAQRAPHSFRMPPGGWSAAWSERPREPVLIGLRRPSVEQRQQASKDALARADRMVPEHRRVAHDPFWRAAYEVALISYLLGYAFCDAEDHTRPFWRDQDGHLMLVEGGDGAAGDCPLTNRRLSDEGLTRAYDELEVLGRMDGIGRRRARDGEVVRLGAALADGSILAALRSSGTSDARAVDEHLRILLGQALDLIEQGRQSPSPVAG